MNRVTKRLAAKAEALVLAVFSAGAPFTPLVMSGQTNVNTATQVAAAVLPLPESMRAAATVVCWDGPSAREIP